MLFPVPGAPRRSSELSSPGASLSSKPGARIALAPGLELRLAPGEDNSLLLLGAPGTGKSAFLDYLLSRLPPSWSALVIDPTGEHAVLARYGYKCLRAGVEFFANPLELGPAAAQDVLEGVIEGSWGERVTPIQSYMLSEALLKARAVPDVVDYLASQVAKAGREDLASAAAALLRRLRPLAKCPALLGHGGLPRGRVVLDASAIEDDASRSAFTLTVLHMIYSAAVRGGWSGLVVVEEADRLGGAEVLNRMCDELRKYGVSVWAVGHSLARVAGKLADARYQLYFATTDYETLRRVDPGGTFLPVLRPFQAVLRARGAQPRVVTLQVPMEVLRARASFKPRPPLPVSIIAAKYGVEPARLAKLYVEWMDRARLVVGFKKGLPLSRSELELMRQLSSREASALAELYKAAGIA